MSAIPTNLYAALNGIAIAAKAAGDTSTISLVETFGQQASFAFAGYFSASASATPAIITNESYPAGSITPSFDSSNSVTPPGTPGSPW